jgi:hypothetical protein
VTRERLLDTAEEAAQAAAREYDSTHRPDWAKRLTR